MRGLSRIVITDDIHGCPTCPHETTGPDLELPEDGHIPDVYPVRQCARCSAWLIDVRSEDVQTAVDGLLRAYPGSQVTS